MSIGASVAAVEADVTQKLAAHQGSIFAKFDKQNDTIQRAIARLDDSQKVWTSQARTLFWCIHY